MKNQQTIKGWAVFAGAVALLLILAAFTGPAWAITGGEPDGNRHPNVGTIIAYYPAYGIIPFGSGTLIHPRVFLTAGHVVAPFQTGEAVLLGVSFDEELVADNPMDPNTWFDYDVVGVVGTYSPPNSRSTANPNQPDIGIFILEEPVTGIEPAVLPAAGLLDNLKKTRQLKAGPNGTRLTVVGYGWDLAFPPPENIWAYEPVEVVYDGQTVLFWGGARNVAQSGYLGMNNAWLDLNQNQAAGYGGTSTGDSGGSVFWTNPATGQEVLVSITSWGGSIIGNGWYYRIDTVKSLNFIQDAIDSLEE